MPTLVAIPPKSDPRLDDAVRTLEGVLEKARDGSVKFVAITYESMDDTWATVSSYAEDKRVTGAMLIELGLRNLGFKGE